MSKKSFSSRSEVHATQTEYPWHAVVRTVFQALVGFAAMWALIVEALGISETIPWVAASLAATGAITRVMAIPQVNAWLDKYLPFLGASGKQEEPLLDGYMGPKTRQVVSEFIEETKSTDTDPIGPLTDSGE